MEFQAFNFKKFTSFILFAFLLNSLHLFGQAKEAGDKYSSKKRTFKLDPERMIVGGGFGAQFGDITLVELSPTVGYLVTENFLAGIGGRYIYFEEKYFANTFRTNIYGANLFSQYFIFQDFIAHVEFERLNIEDFYTTERRTNINSFFVGGGYRSMLGEQSFASILLLFNLNDQPNSPYTNPIIRVGFGFGL